MKRIELVKIRSYLWRNDKQNPAIAEIDKETSTSLHPQTEINAVFSHETQKVIQDTNKAIKSAENKRKIELKKLEKRRKK